MSQENKPSIPEKDKIKIEEEQTRLREFLDILLEADLRTIKRLEEKQQSFDKGDFK
ncbi:MAG: hypothetical protein ABIH08_03580 [Candidatus Omnitrophota bacterium]